MPYTVELLAVIKLFYQVKESEAVTFSMYLLEVMLHRNFQMFNFKAWELKSQMTAKLKLYLSTASHISTAKGLFTRNRY